MRSILNDLGNFSSVQQRLYAPTGSNVSDGYLHRHLDEGPVEYSPGGSLGGGSYRKHVGVLAGTSDHPFYVHFGTKNPEGSVVGMQQIVGGIQGRIYPRGDRGAASIYAPGAQANGRDRRITERVGLRNGFLRSQTAPALTFQKRGEERRFRPYVQGQRPQPFVYYSYITTSIYAKSQAETIAERAFN